MADQNNPQMTFQQKQELLLRLLNTINTNTSQLLRWMATEGTKISSGEFAGKIAFDAAETKEYIGVVTQITTGLASLTSVMGSIPDEIPQDGSPISQLKTDIKNKVSSTLEEVANSLSSAVDNFRNKTGDTRTFTEDSDTIDALMFQQLGAMAFGTEGSEVLGKKYGKYAESYIALRDADTQGWPSGLYNRGKELVVCDKDFTFVIVAEAMQLYKVYFKLADAALYDVSEFYNKPLGSTTKVLLFKVRDDILAWLNENAIEKPQSS